jgi:endonuclease/exonuclease/phosphatase family metal-dependent hydrolase
MRIATFNIENLDDGPVRSDQDATFEVRVRVLRPMLERLRADVICFQEVHGQQETGGGAPRTLRALRTLLHATRYEGYSLSSSLDEDGNIEALRNLVVAAHPDWTVAEVRSIRNSLVNPPEYSQVTADGDPSPVRITWERPALYVRLIQAGKPPLHILNVHFKSKNPTDIAGQKVDRFTWATASGWAEGFFLSSLKRVGAALEARIFIDTLFDQDPEARVLICGDFNAEPDEVPVMTIRGRTEDTGNSALNGRVMYPVALSIAESRRFTLFHHGRGNLLDHMLVSRPMMASFMVAEIHNELIHDESIAFAFDVKFPESDHAPMVAEFDINAPDVPPEV